jgi:hypothetical protein
MKSAAVKVRPGDKIRLSEIDPDDTGKLNQRRRVRALCRPELRVSGQKSDEIPRLAIALAEAAVDRAVDLRWRYGNAAHSQTFRQYRVDRGCRSCISKATS